MFNDAKTTHTNTPQSKKTLLVMIMFMLFMVFSPLVSSAPPFQTSSGASSWQVRTEFIDVHKINTQHEFIAHIYNESNGVPITSGASCYFHLYNQHGNHLLELTDTTTSHSYDYEFIANAGNFTTAGQYSYLIQCNSSTQGGFIAWTFEVTPNGELADTGTAVFYIGLLAVLLFFLALTIYSFTQFDNLLNRVGMIGIGYLLIIAITFIGWNMALDFLTSSPFLIEMLRILFFVFIIGFFPLVIGGFIWYFLMLWRIKEIQGLMGKGMSEDEAQRRVSRR